MKLKSKNVMKAMCIGISKAGQVYLRCFDKELKPKY